jgi:hypothetical protein
VSGISGQNRAIPSQKIQCSEEEGNASFNDILESRRAATKPNQVRTLFGMAQRKYWVGAWAFWLGFVFAPHVIGSLLILGQ